MKHFHDYLVCYDICDPKRGGRVFRACCKVATPYQYSVFHLCGDRSSLEGLLNTLEGIVNPLCDDVRAYRIDDLAALRALGEMVLPEGLYAL